MTTLVKERSVKEKYNLENSYDLIYIDYNDQIEDHKMQEQILQNGVEAVDEPFYESFHDSESYSAHEILDEIDREHPEMTQEDKDEILDYIYEHDVSDPIHDLLKNTPSEYFYYSLGISDNGMEAEGGDSDKKRISVIEK